MSDYEDYSDSDSDNSISDNGIYGGSGSGGPSFIKKDQPKQVKTKSITIDDYEDENDENDNGLDNENEDNENDDIEIEGGAISDLEEGEIKDELSEDENDLEDDDDDNEPGATMNEQMVDPDEPVKSKSAKQIIQFDSDDDDDVDENDENYLQKFDQELTRNYIKENHPECFVHNYDEIANLTKVIRNSDNIIVDPLHKTVPFLTKYEKARVLGQRSKQIEAGAKPFVRVPENVVDSYIIAELELSQKRIPFIIRRPLPNASCEYWNLKDLENINF